MANLDNSPSIQTFIDGIIEEKGMESLDPEVLTQLKQDLSSRVEDRINAAIVDSLPDHKRAEFSSLLDQSPSEDIIQSFLKSNISNFEALVAAELVKFREIYLAS